MSYESSRGAGCSRSLSWLVVWMDYELDIKQIKRRHEAIPTLMTLMRHHRRRRVMPPCLLPYLLRLWAIQTFILRNGDVPAVVPVTV